MPTVTNELYKITLQGTYFDQTWVNVFWYYNFAGVGNETLAQVASGFDDNIIDAMAAAQNEDVLYKTIRVSHVNGTLADVNITPSQVNGDIVNTPMAPFLAASIRLNRTTKETRNGWKRIVGLTEENTGATSFSGAFTTLLTALGTAILDPISAGTGTDNLVPVIVRETSPGNWIYNDIQSIQVINKPTTQNTRKIGTGV